MTNLTEKIEEITEYIMCESSREPDGERLWIKTSYELADIIKPILLKHLPEIVEEAKKEGAREMGEKIYNWSLKNIQTGGDMGDKLHLMYQSGYSFCLTDLQVFIDLLSPEPISKEIIK